MPAAGRSRRLRPPAEQPVQEPVWTTTLTRPRSWPKHVARFEGPPDVLTVPAELQTSLPADSKMYVLISGCAHLLTEGLRDALVVGDDVATPLIAFREPEGPVGSDAEF
jgi:hypothetical protein